MSFKIGFPANHTASMEQVNTKRMRTEAMPRKSVVRVRFPDKGMPLAYYNDRFDLHIGDRVYVNGKMEGIQGRVVEVSYHFKIKVSEYKNVIAVVDTQVNGELYMAGSHFVTFDPEVLPYEQVRSWLKAPAEEEEVVVSTDGNSFPLEDLSRMDISVAVAQRGHEYYADNKVRCIILCGDYGRAIVEGTEIYEVEFCYQDGQISELVCDCPCTGHCKHEFAAMLQLRETLDLIKKHYGEKMEESHYFLAVYKPLLFAFAIDGKESGRILM